MRSIEKLRQWAKCLHGVKKVNDSKTAAFLDDGAIAKVNEIAEEIEREVAEEYMKLPVGGDGESIRFGDVLSQFGKPVYVYAITDPEDEGDCMICVIEDDGKIGDHSWVRARKMSHYDDDPLSPILEQFWRNTYGITFPGDKNGLLAKEIKGCSNSIRKCLGVSK